MYRNNIKPKVGEMVKIIAYKHDGSLHRIWHKNVVLDADEKTLLLANHKTSVTENNGRTWVTKESAFVYFHDDCWFNIVCMFREDGCHYYCNLSSPFAYDEDGVKYIDYDLDIKKYPDGKYFVLDEDEYELHKLKYDYGEDIDNILRYNVSKLKHWIEYKLGPFSKEFIHVWTAKYNDMKNKY